MMYINRREMGSKDGEKPFNAGQTKSTMVKYSNVWLEIISYVWRTHELPVVRPSDSEDEVEGKRPPYRITPKQEQCIKKIRRIVGRDRAADEVEETESDDKDDWLDDQQEQALEGYVLQFMLLLLDHILGDNEYASALISGMAVLGISPESSGWLDPMGYTPKQSAVVAISRMLVLYQATLLRQGRVDQLLSEGYAAADAANIAPPHLEFVQEMANRFITLTEYNGKPTPMNAVLQLRAFGFKIRFTTKAEGTVDWIGDTLLIGNIQFSMPQLRSMVHGMIASARQQMLASLMLLQMDGEGGIAADTTACPAIHWDRLVDNGAETKVGWSFMEDPRNKHATSVEDPKEWLNERLQSEGKLQGEFVDVEATKSAIARGRGVVWVEIRVRAYGLAMKEARRRLAALVHMTGGAPPRGSELVSIKYRNSANGSSRGVFIEDGLVAFVTRYHKNVRQTGNDKVIYRYVPREVGELVVYYLWFASPFWQKINWAARGKAVEGGDYVWEPKPEKSWPMPVRKRGRGRGASSQAGSSSQASNKRARGASQRSGGPRRDVEDESSNENESPEQEQREVKLWNGNQVKHALQKEGLQYIGVALNIHRWRHSTKAIYRRYIGNPAAVKAFDEADASKSEDESEVPSRFWDMQTGHRSAVAGAIYRRPISEPIFSVESTRWRLRTTSVEWHAFLQITSVISEKLVKGTQAAATRREAREEERRR
jgi:hypothetical protein